MVEETGQPIGTNTVGIKRFNRSGVWKVADIFRLLDVKEKEIIQVSLHIEPTGEKKIILQKMKN